MAHFSRFVQDQLLHHPAVIDVKTSFALERIKETTALRDPLAVCVAQAMPRPPLRRWVDASVQPHTIGAARGGRAKGVSTAYQAASPAGTARKTSNS
jgi:hypothetical protein